MTGLKNKLQLRAALYRSIRDYFHNQNVLEVTTPVLSYAANTDPTIASMVTADEPPMYLQTSPEFFMKRLLVEGSGSIFKICPAFRAGESGRLHNPEFTMLEWYRVGFDYQQLMDDVVALLNKLTGKALPVHKLSYEQAFKPLTINPHLATIEQLQQVASTANVTVQSDLQLSRDDWLNLLMSHRLEAEFDPAQLTFVYDYPASQASLAKVRSGGKYPVAERFELYFGSVELANGFSELADANEQRWRFEQNNRRRQQLGLPLMPLDEALLAALDQGLPDCSGVALGIDRLLMVLGALDGIMPVMPFPIDRV